MTDRETERDARRRSTNAHARALSESYLADLDGDPHDGLADAAIREYAEALRTTAAGAAADEDARLDALDRWLGKYADRGADRAALDDARAVRCICADLGAAGPEQRHTRCLADHDWRGEDDDAYEPDDDPFYAAYLVEQEATFAKECGASAVLGPREDPYATSCSRTRGHEPAPHAGAHPLGEVGAILVWTGGGSVDGDPLPLRSVATLVANAETGSFLERNDPDPRGSVGRLYAPMNEDGSADLDNLGEIDVRWEDA